MIRRLESPEFHINGGHFDEVETPEWQAWEAWEQDCSHEWCYENPELVLDILERHWHFGEIMSLAEAIWATKFQDYDLGPFWRETALYKAHNWYEALSNGDIGSDYLIKFAVSPADNLPPEVAEAVGNVHERIEEHLMEIYEEYVQ